jgi:hypothetical protein
MINRAYRIACTLVLVLASACSTAASGTRPAQAGPAAALPGIPEVSGSAINGSSSELPSPARALLADIGCPSVGSKAVIEPVLDPSGQPTAEYLASDTTGTRYHYWIRSFAGTGGVTGYLVQLNGCPANTAGMRAYTVTHGGKPVDVTADIIDKGLPISPAAMVRYQAAGVSELYADTALLGRTPVLRWLAEADTDRVLPEDSRTLEGGYLVHGGFLRWADNRFILTDTVPARLWPCTNTGAGECIEKDRFVKPK